MTVAVVAHDPRWPARFAREADALQAAIGESIVAVHHIGSTAVPGLAAKPIIDILLEISTLQALDRRVGAFGALGYEAMGEFGIAGRRYFRKGRDRRTHHVHAFATGNAHIVRHLAFRDYLAAHPDIARAYGRLKHRLAVHCDDDIQRYAAGKDAFVKTHEQRALVWCGA